MKQNYSINEILSAVEELQNKKKVKKNKIIGNKFTKEDNLTIPKSTLKLIEEAEQNNN
jgi:hypothetical protein